MNHKTDRNIHWSFWVIGVLALIWNLMSCVNFFMQMNPDMLASYRDAEQTIVSSRPAWATIAFGIAVFGGALGSILLLLKKHSAFYFFVASLLGTIVATSQSLSSGISFGVGEIIGIIVMPIAVAGVLVWYTKYAKRRGWLSV